MPTKRIGLTCVSVWRCGGAWIRAEACRVLEKEPMSNDQWWAVNGLGILAAGKQEYIRTPFDIR